MRIDPPLEPATNRRMSRYQAAREEPMIVDEGTLASTRPSRSVLRHARLKRLFPRSIDKLCNSRIAGLCVLFEDLRIEITGLFLPRTDVDDVRGMIAGFDIGGYKLRQLYFLRRSIATCSEFAEAIRLLNESPGFRKLLSHFPADGQTTWRDSVRYFRNHERFWKDIRNDIGGHFGPKAAEFAVDSFLPDAGGAIELHLNHAGKGGVVLGFASEIAGTALLKHLPGENVEDQIAGLFKEAETAFSHGVRAVECIVTNHIWGLAGSG
jgi:hypothetical protein